MKLLERNCYEGPIWVKLNEKACPIKRKSLTEMPGVTDKGEWIEIQNGMAQKHFGGILLQPENTKGLDFNPGTIDRISGWDYEVLWEHQDKAA
jgi:hypothetical protein